MNWTGEAIAVATGGRLHGGEHVGPVSTDSRGGIVGAWFVALVGERFDGHDFAEGAAAAGAGGGVFSRPVPGWARAWVEVPDTTAALQALGAAARDRLKGPVVGVGGAAGKTTTRVLVALALAPLGTVHQTQANLNNHLGVPLTLLGAEEGAAASVVELGTSAPGEILTLTSIARPDVRLIVNIGPEHLEELGGIEGVAREECVLFDSARPGDVCLVNTDDPWLAAWPIAGRVIRWGRAANADVRLVHAEVDGPGWCTRATYDTPLGRVELTLPAPGEHLAHNAAAAVAAALALGVDLHQAARAMAAYAPVGMRLRPVRLPGEILAINDAYNANPPSMRASLATLTTMPGRRVAVLGDMLELGVDEARLHDEVVGEADRKGLDLLLLVGPRMVRSHALAVRTPTWASVDGPALASQLANWLQPGDTVLFKGSRGARVERVLDALTLLLEARP